MYHTVYLQWRLHCIADTHVSSMYEPGCFCRVFGSISLFINDLVAGRRSNPRDINAVPITPFITTMISTNDSKPNCFILNFQACRMKTCLKLIFFYLSDNTF